LPGAKDRHGSTKEMLPRMRNLEIIKAEKGGLRQKRTEGATKAATIPGGEDYNGR